MATLAIDRLIVAKINGLLASFPSDHPQSGLSTEEIVELFEFCLLEALDVAVSEQKHRQREWLPRREKLE